MLYEITLNEVIIFQDLLYISGHCSGRLKHIIRSVSRMKNCKLKKIKIRIKYGFLYNNIMIKVLCESLQDHLKAGRFTQRTHKIQKCYTDNYSLLQGKDTD